MTQLVVHVRKEGAERAQPAYAVWVSDTEASVRAFGPEWEEAAGDLEAMLKSTIPARRHRKTSSVTRRPLRLRE